MDLMLIIFAITLILALVIKVILVKSSKRSGPSIHCKVCIARLPIQDSEWGVTIGYNGESKLTQFVTCKSCGNSFYIKRPMEPFEKFVYWPSEICAWVLDYTEKALQSNAKDGGLWLLRGWAYLRVRGDLYDEVWKRKPSPIDHPELREYDKCIEQAMKLRRKDGTVPCKFYNNLIIRSSSPSYQEIGKEIPAMSAVLYFKVMSGGKELDEKFTNSIVNAVNSIHTKIL